MIRDPHLVINEASLLPVGHVHCVREDVVYAAIYTFLRTTGHVPIRERIAVVIVFTRTRPSVCWCAITGHRCYDYCCQDEQIYTHTHSSLLLQDSYSWFSLARDRTILSGELCEHFSSPRTIVRTHRNSDINVRIFVHACGRLAGTVLLGLIHEWHGLPGLSPCVPDSWGSIGL